MDDLQPKGEGRDQAPPASVEPAKGSYFSEAKFRVWLAGVVAVSLVFGLQSYYPSLIGPISNVLPPAGAAGAFTAALLCWRRYGLGLRQGFEAVWFCFTLGTGLWFLADLTWAIYYFVLNVPVPYPSAADFFYLGGYLPMIAGLLFYLSTFRRALSGKRLLAAFAAVAAAVVLAMGVVLPMELSQSLSAAQLIADLEYPILDLVLVSLTILLLTIFTGGSISKWWHLFGIASTLYVIGDEYFLYLVASGTYYNGSLDDLLFVLGYFTFALAFLTHRREF